MMYKTRKIGSGIQKLIHIHRQEGYRRSTDSSSGSDTSQLLVVVVVVIVKVVQCVHKVHSGFWEIVYYVALCVSLNVGVTIHAKLDVWIL
jgi:hypothetical protein